MDNTQKLDRLYFISVLLAVTGWLAAIVLAGLLTHSWLIAGGIVLGFALFIFGYIKEGSAASSNVAKPFPWILMIGSLLLIISILFSQKLGWIGIGLLLIQIIQKAITILRHLCY